MAHTCHATACKENVPPEMFMCRKHWFNLPMKMRNKIWANYRPGQCDDKNPSMEYCLIAKECVIYLARKEGIEPDTLLYDIYLNSLD